MSLLASGCGDDTASTPDASPDAQAGTDAAASSPAVLLIGNSNGNNIVMVDPDTGEIMGDLVAASAGVLSHPDTLAFGPDGALYVSSGDTVETSAVLRFDARTGELIDTFTKGGDMLRPYGFAFGPDNRLYVASFLTDQILRYDATTGDFIDVFAEGNGMPGGLNGPNGMTFGPDGMLYVTTQGSVAVDGMPTFPGLPSQVLRLDIQTGESSVFIEQPELSPAGNGFVSLLGVVFGPDCPTVCDLFVSDFANDIRRYNAMTGELLAVLSTNYSGVMPSNNFLGSLDFDDKGQLFTVGFDKQEGSSNHGAVLRFDGTSNAPLPAAGQEGAILVPQDERLLRPIGIAVRPAVSGT